MSDSLLNIKPLGFQWKTRDPFLFCVHHLDDYPKGNGKLGPEKSLLSERNIGQDFTLKDGWRMYHGGTIPGFPAHPHRGFETVTVVRQGLIDHADSMGGGARYGNGDVQWLTSGKGIQHSEMFPLLDEEKGNPLELFQIWLNLPSSSKMVEPYFKMLWEDTIPTYNGNVDGIEATIEIIAGNLFGLSAPAPPPDSWASESVNSVGIFNIQLGRNQKLSLPAPKANANRTIYFYEGNGLRINNTEIPHYHSVDADGKVEITLESSNEELKILILEGCPINETVVQHGPFVMNTSEEIQQTFRDYQNSQFGGWPWSTHDQTHGHDQVRFAKHPDGTMETKD